MVGLPNPHDAFFKERLANVETARDFVANYLPSDVVEVFDLSTLAISKDSFVDEELRSHYSDLLYQVGLKGGGEALIGLLFEHKSHPEGDVAFDLLRYKVQAWRLRRLQGKGLPLPPIVGVVFYHGCERWQVSAEFGELVAAPEALRRYVPAFRYELCDLSRYSDDELKGEVGLRAALLLMKHIFDDAPAAHVEKALRLLFEALGPKTGLESIEAYLRYVVGASDRLGAEEFKALLDRLDPELGGEMMLTLAEQWKNEGKIEGKIEGKNEGKIEGKIEGLRSGAREDVNEVLESRFGVFARSLRAQVEAVEDLALLKALLRAAATAGSVEEFRRGL